MDSILKFLSNKFLLLFIISFSISVSSFGQYKAIELNIGVSRYLDDNLDQEFEYTFWNVRGLAHYNLGYSFPISKKFLLTPKVGFAFAKENYIRNTESNFTFIDGDFTFEKNKAVFFGKIGLESTYWIKPTFSGLFFSGQLCALYMVSATSERTTRIYDASQMKFSELPTENISLTDKFQTIVPTVRMGVGYNLNFFKRLNFFAIMNLEYRPSGYYKNTQNITHISRTLNLGLKYVIKGGTTFLKQREKKNVDN